MATNSSILAWRIPWTEEPGRLWSTESQRVRHNWATDTFTNTIRKSFPYTLRKNKAKRNLAPSRRQWHPTPVLLPGKSHGWRSLVGCSPWVAKSRTRLSDFTFTFHFHALEKAMATHSSVLAWRIPGTGEPGGLPEVYGVAQGRTWLKWLSSSSSSSSSLISRCPRYWQAPWC